MKTLLKHSFWLAIFLVCCVALRAAAFGNLDFENINRDGINRFGLPPWRHDYGEGKISDLLPGWQISRSGVSLTGMGYNWPGPNVALGQGAANVVQGGVLRDIWDDYFPGWSDRFQVSGDYALLILTGTTPASGTSIALQQSGDIPLGAKYLYYNALFPIDEVLINGVSIPGDLIAPGVYRHDIGAFAGQTADLEFIFGAGPFGQGTWNGIDNIRFMVPEPAPMVLLGAGGVLLWWLSKRRGQHRTGRVIP